MMSWSFGDAKKKKKNSVKKKSNWKKRKNMRTERNNEKILL